MDDCTDDASAEKFAEDPKKLSVQRHGRSSSRTANSDVQIPKFFPTDMMEEQITIFKEMDNKAQKRHAKRDEKREFENPDRDQRVENKGRACKTQQSEDCGNSSIDHYADDDGNAEGFGYRHETKHLAKCEK